MRIVTWPGSRALRAVSRLIGDVGLVGIDIRVDRVEDDAAVRRGERVQPVEGSGGTVGVADQPEVAAHHEHRVEHPEFVLQSAQREQPSVSDSTAATDLHRPRRHVDRNDVRPATLRLHAVPAGAGADVQHAAAHVAEHGPLGIQPPLRLGKEPFRPQSGPGVAVVAFENTGSPARPER